MAKSHVGDSVLELSVEVNNLWNIILPRIKGCGFDIRHSLLFSSLNWLRRVLKYRLVRVNNREGDN